MILHLYLIASLLCLVGAQPAHPICPLNKELYRNEEVTYSDTGLVETQGSTDPGSRQHGDEIFEDEVRLHLGCFTPERRESWSLGHMNYLLAVKLSDDGSQQCTQFLVILRTALGTHEATTTGNFFLFVLRARLLLEEVRFLMRREADSSSNPGERNSRLQITVMLTRYNQLLNLFDLQRRTNLMQLAPGVINAIRISRSKETLLKAYRDIGVTLETPNHFKNFYSGPAFESQTLHPAALSVKVDRDMSAYTFWAYIELTYFKWSQRFDSHLCLTTYSKSTSNLRTTSCATIQRHLFEPQIRNPTLGIALPVVLPYGSELSQAAFYLEDRFHTIREYTIEGLYTSIDMLIYPAEKEEAHDGQEPTP